MRFSTLLIPLLVALALAACATPQDRTSRAEKDFGPACEKRGYARGSEQWRACVETEDLNTGLATQRDYEQQYLRKRDCVDPKFGC